MTMPGFHRLSDLPDERVSDRITRRALSGDQAMVTWWSVKAGAYARIPGGVVHENRFLEDSETIEVFGPPREDFLGVAPSMAAFR